MDDECDPTDPQDLVVIQVDPGTPPPLEIGIASATDLSPSPTADDIRFINISTNPALPDNTVICLFMVVDTTDMDDDTEIDDSSGAAEADVGDTECHPLGDGDGTLNGNFHVEIDDDATEGQFVTIQGCIDFDDDNNSSACDVGEPLSNTITFTVVPDP